MAPAVRKIVAVAGARPQFIKAAMLGRRLRDPDAPALRQVLVHTGQHYDDAMSELFFRELGIPAPDYRLETGSASPSKQTAMILERLEPILRAEAPDAVVVFGDTNTTLAAALAAVQSDLPAIHVEAGERTYRRRQVPEESNRVAVDHLSHLCLAATEQAAVQLRREGIAGSRIRVTGDLHDDLFRWGIEQRSLRSTTPEKLNLAPGGFLLATIHRVENTEDSRRLLGLLKALDAGSEPVVLPMHPRLRKKIEGLGYVPEGALRLIDPVGYLDLLGLLEGCRLAVTDSGGVLREAYLARKPTIAPMDRHCWEDLIAAGWSAATGANMKTLKKRIAEPWTSGPYLENYFGDGRAAERIVDEIVWFIDSKKDAEPWTIYGDSSQSIRPPEPRPRFSHAAHLEMLSKLKQAGYAFATFGEAEGLLASGERFVLLRHDIDIDIEAALQLARDEAAAGARATFFIMTTCPFYNLLDPAVRRAVDMIGILGHAIGLHFDAAAHDAASAPETLAQACRAEAELLEKLFGKKIEIVSLHRPDARALTDEGAMTAPLPHTYLQLYREKIPYFSDSRGEWRDGHPLESVAFAARRPLQLLVHPIWYADPPRSALETLESFIDRRQTASRRRLAENCAPYRLGEWGKDL